MIAEMMHRFSKVSETSQLWMKPTDIRSSAIMAKSPIFLPDMVIATSR